MGVTDIYKSSSDYLKASDLNKKAVKLIMDDIEKQEFGEGDNLHEKLVVSFLDKEKTLVLNKTNACTIASQYGDDYNTWKGLEIVIFPTTTNFNGEMVDCIRVRIDVPVEEDQGNVPF